MIGLNFTFVDDTRKVQAAADRATNRAIAKTAFAIRKDSQASIVKAPKISRTAGIARDGRGRFIKGSGRKRVIHAASPPGTPPYTARGQLRNAIVYAHDKAAKRAVIGPRFSVAGISGTAHEFGGEYKGADYPERPFMGPSLERNISNFSADLGGSLGG